MILPVNIGMDEEARSMLAMKFKKVLADTFYIYLTAQNFHWNIKGFAFGPLHNFFSEQYENYYEALDPIAERILSLGYNAPGSFRELISLSNLLDPPSEGMSAEDMLMFLLKAQELILQTLNEAIELADSLKDQVSVDLLTNRQYIHQKYAWQIRKHLE